jgi:magnesium transporter
MAMLSSLLRLGVVDGHGRKGRLGDLVVDLSGGDYSPVTSLLVLEAESKAIVRVPVQGAQWACMGARGLEIEDFGRAEAPSPEWLERVVLLKRDILDAMVIDLQDRMAYRANDLWLAEQDGGLVLSAVDISFRAILRRVSRGLITSQSSRRLRDWRTIEFLRGDPAAARAHGDYHGLIGRLPAGEIANLADALPYLHAAELIALLPRTKAADTLESMIPERQLQVFLELTNDEARAVLALMRPDIVADLLGRLEPGEARYWLEHMPSRQFERVLQLLRYPEDSAGGIMTNDLIALPADLTVGDAITELREQLKQPAFINFIDTIYVVENSTHRLQGTLPLRHLLVAAEGQRLEQVMDPYVVGVRPTERAIDAARRVIENELPALPVLGSKGELLGAVTVDAALLLVVPETWGRRELPRLFS